MTPISKLILTTLLIGCASAGWFIIQRVRSVHIPSDRELAIQRETSTVVPWVRDVLSGTNRVRLEYHNDQALYPHRDDELSGVSRLIDELRSTTYQKVAHGLWVTKPSIGLYRGDQRLATLQQNGLVLRIMGTSVDGDYVVSEKLSSYMSQLSSKPVAN